MNKILERMVKILNKIWFGAGIAILSHWTFQPLTSDRTGWITTGFFLLIASSIIEK